MIVIDCVQGSEEWKAVRVGVPSASNFDKIVTTKGEPSKQAQKYMYQLAGERVSGIREEGFQNDAMKRGVELEAEARSEYELIESLEIQQVGFCFDDLKRYGCSPDGLVGKQGMVQFKCPLLSTHIGYLIDGTFPMDYFQQVQGELFVTGRKWTDFVSYYPGLKRFKVRVERNEEFISKLKTELDKFCNELEKTVEKIK